MNKEHKPCGDGCAGCCFCMRESQEPAERSNQIGHCKRIELSGEPCGLKPPCPDCGLALHDAGEGA